MAKKKILVIEDEPTVLENVIELLDDMDFEVIGAPNGRIGIEIAMSILPDLIISDIIMPEVDGYGVISQLRSFEKTSSIPIILLTAKSELNDIRHGMGLGADDYLTKPFQPDELYKSVNNRLEKLDKITNKSQEMLRDLRLKIASTIPHELRTPLNGIMASTQILIEYYDNMEDEEIKQLHRNIFNSSKRLQELVARYLYYSSIELLYYNHESQKIIMETAVPFNTSDVISKSISFAAQENKREEDLKFFLSDCQVNMLTDHFQNICNELFSNSVKFSKPGTPIEISTLIADKYFILKFKNYGRGMTNEQMNQIGAYMQFDRNIYEQQGSGLGLIITKRITQIYKGKLEIDSDGNSYTEVSVYLPQNLD